MLNVKVLDGGQQVVSLTLDTAGRPDRPLRLKNGTAVQLTSFRQGGVVDPELDAFGAGASHSGLRYRYYAPKRSLRPARSKAAFVLFLHGGGEGGWSKSYDNDLPLLANRGALAFATNESQQIHKGAYVVAPQAWTRWLAEGDDAYTRRPKSLVDEFVKGHDVDPSRIYVVGPSNDGYLALKLASAYPRFLAADVPVSAAYVLKDQATGTTRAHAHRRADPAAALDPDVVRPRHERPGREL